MTLRARFGRLHLRSRAQPATPWEERQDRLQRLRQLLLRHRDDIAAAISADFGNRSQHETQFLEVFTSLQAIDHALAHGKHWMQPQVRPAAIWFKPAGNRLLPQPLGVVGIVTPWNYPLLLTIGPLACALAAGNLAMIKLSENTPAFGELFDRLIRQSFSEDEIIVINGGVDLSREFCALAFDHLIFTGSTAVGREVMRIASERLTPVTLELGGKSPAIIAADADFKHAVARIMNGKLLNAGQTCIAPDYVLLPRGRERDFVDAARAVVARMYPALNDERMAIDDYTSIVNERHFTRLQALLDDAREGGATVEKLTTHTPHPSTRLLPPMALTQVAPEARILQEEIFGPLLPLVTYEHLDEAIAFVNARPRPLALYVFAKSDTAIDQVLLQTVAGGVTVNDTLLHIAQENLPFGGVGASGMGAYHGEEGFRRFSHMKPVFTQSRFNVMRLFNPPYGRLFSLLMKFLIR
ncbi:coniferyl aldehyde dehydrogenase [Herbaspirillum lusitanum]|uniref:coniferyl aldehyde dehydrogenase n=1 Tax=Herbaspirillum lusitanum TaxID=213312 RepID=UPI0022381A23|nr:coniferyl aldehyde dehydrogenase [Herbaspirillum lusitanum]MCW5298488.1 coniferyl aldehyde dehydrogenase [Herbaspirillum lusitanum]